MKFIKKYQDYNYYKEYNSTLDDIESIDEFDYIYNLQSEVYHGQIISNDKKGDKRYVLNEFYKYIDRDTLFEVHYFEKTNHKMDIWIITNNTNDDILLLNNYYKSAILSNKEILSDDKTFGHFVDEII